MGYLILMTGLALSLYMPIYFFLFVAVWMSLDDKLDNRYIFITILMMIVYSFYLREYGIQFSLNASDDSLNYVGAYKSLGADRYDGYFEPVYILFMKSVGLLTGYNGRDFVFIQYLFSIGLLLYSLKLILKNHYLIGFIFILSSSPFIYNYLHIFRQALGFSIALYALYHASEERHRVAIPLFISASLTHYALSTLFASYILFIVVYSRMTIPRKTLLFIVIFILILVNSYFLNAIMMKFDAYSSHEEVQKGIFQYMKFVIMMLFGAFLLFRYRDRNDLLLKYLAFFTMLGGTLMLMVAHMDAISDRIGMMYKMFFSISILYFIFFYSHPRRYAVAGIIVWSLLNFVTLSSRVDTYNYLLHGKITRIYDLPITEIYDISPENLPE